VTIRQERSTNLVESLSESVAATEQGHSTKDLQACDRHRAQTNRALKVAVRSHAAGSHESANPEKTKRSLECIVTALLVACRDTDLVGWYKDIALSESCSQDS